ncbi:hypothetical protein EDD86DRAFT_268384, partial [Gorgonomyces haynaldii]
MIGFGGTTFLFSYLCMALTLVVNQLMAKIRMDIESGKGKPELSLNKSILVKLFLLLKHDPFVPRQPTSKGSNSVSGSNTSLDKQKRKQSLGSGTLENLGPDADPREDWVAFNGHIPDRMIAFHLFVMLLLVLAVTIVSIYVFYDQPYSNQYTSQFAKACVCGLAGVITILLFQMVYAIKGLRDSLGVKYELVAFITIFFPSLLAYCMFEWGKSFRGTSFETEVGSHVVLLISAILMFLSTNVYILGFSFYEEHVKSQFAKPADDQSPQTGMEDLLAIINNHQKMKLLKQHLVEDLCPENAYFIEELFLAHCKLNRPIVIRDQLGTIKMQPQQTKIVEEEGESHLKAVKDINEQVVIKYLYKKYIKPDAPSELNIPSKMRKEITAALQQSKELTLGIYDNVRDEVLRMIYTNNYPRFKAKEG